MNNLFLLNIFLVPQHFPVQDNFESICAKILENKNKKKKLKKKKPHPQNNPLLSWAFLHQLEAEILAISQGMKIYRPRRLNKHHPGSCLFGCLPKPRKEYNGRVHLSIFSSCLPKSNPTKLPLFLEICNFTTYLVRPSMDLACKERPTLRTMVTDRVGILSKPFVWAY